MVIFYLYCYDFHFGSTVAGLLQLYTCQSLMSFEISYATLIFSFKLYLSISDKGNTVL